MGIIFLMGCVLVGMTAMLILFIGYINEEEQQMQEVKVFDRDGKLKKVITVKQLHKEHWQRFYNVSKFGDQKPGRKPKGKEEEVCISD